MMVELLGFAPDAEPTTPGVMTECQNIIPFERGFRAAPLPENGILPALAAECRGASVLRDLSNNKRTLAGTAAKLYEASGTAYADVSTSTAGYSLGDEDRWCFASFGNTYLAATPTKRIQQSSSSTFTEITTAPKAEIIVATTNFVLAFHTSETTYGDSPDRWWCSALYDVTDWTPAVSTQATTGRLLDGQGAIKAAARFGSDVVAYKERGTFVGRYAGAPSVWDWTPVSEDVGCVGQEAVAVTSIGHIFVGSDNIYLFDGVRPMPLATDQVRQWWLDNSSPQYRSRSKVLWDRFNNLTWIFFPSAQSTGTCDYCLVFHVLRRRWGRADMSVEAVLTYISTGGLTYDSTTDLIIDYDTGPSLSYDAIQWSNEAENPAIFNTTHRLQTLSGAPSTSSFTTGDIGDDVQATMCAGIRLKCSQSQTIADCTGYTRENSGGALTSTGAVDLDDGSFDVRQTGRWHRFTFDLSGDFRFSAYEPDLKAAGRR